MLQAGRDLDLAMEPLSAKDGREVIPQHLERDSALVFKIVDEVDHGHPPASQLAFEQETVG